MRTLITGGAGFIGSALARHVTAKLRWPTMVIDKLTYAGHLSSIADVAGSPHFSFLRADICDRDAVDAAFAAHRPDIVFHLAAESHVDRSITGSSAFVQTNVVGTHTLLEAALRYWEGLKDTPARDRFRFLHISTDEVYGSLGEEGLFSETTGYDPRSPYAASKAASDHLASAWRHTYGLPVVVTNCSNNYGPYQYPEKLIPAMILKAMAGEPLGIYGDGRNVRDWLYVDDHAAALELIASKGRVGETYNVGGRSEKKNIDVATAIRDLVAELKPDSKAQRSEIEFVKDRPGHDRRYAIDCSKIERELGWRSVEDFETGLRKTVRWYLDRRDWWGPICESGFQGERLGLRGP